MSFESSSIVAIVIGAIAVLGSIVYALVRAVSIRSHLRRISQSPAAVAAAKLPALGERISIGVQRVRTTGERLGDLIERIRAARDSGGRFRSSIDSIAACVVDLLDTFVPSQRGSAS